MMDIEKMLTEVREAAVAAVSLNKKDRLRRALAAFTAEMPGAIGRVMRNPEHEAVCATGVGPGRPCDCGLAAALAKLEGK